MDRIRLRRIAEYLAFRAIVAVVWFLPVSIQRVLAWAFACLLSRILPRKLTRYEIARQNIRLSLGDHVSDADIDRIIFRMWEHLIRLVCEVVQFPKWVTCENVQNFLEFRNIKPAVRALCSGRSVILVSGHFGNWEAAIATFGTFGFPMGVVARALDNPYLDDWFRRFRQSTGHVMIDKQGGGSEMVARLEQRRHLALLADQDAGPRGVFVDFFGRPASTFKSIALLALQHDALICVGYAFRLPDARGRSWVKYELGAEEIIDPRTMTTSDPVWEMTQRYTSALERAIRRAPEQYFWVHRRWKHQPVARPERRERKAG